jgi:hypothetical protein
MGCSVQQIEQKGQRKPSHLYDPSNSTIWNVVVRMVEGVCNMLRTASNSSRTQPATHTHAIPEYVQIALSP